MNLHFNLRKTQEHKTLDITSKMLQQLEEKLTANISKQKELSDSQNIIHELLCMMKRIDILEADKKQSSVRLAEVERNNIHFMNNNKEIQNEHKRIINNKIEMNNEFDRILYMMNTMSLKLDMLEARLSKLESPVIINDHFNEDKYMDKLNSIEAMYKKELKELKKRIK